jgi:hypothetical protein
MRRDTDPPLAGVEGLRQAHVDQIAVVEQWAAVDDWERLHLSSHG